MSDQNQLQQQKNQVQNVLTEPNAMEMALQRMDELVKSGMVNVAPNYSYQNAMRLGWLMIIDNGYHEKATKPSIMFALLKMAMEGLNPAKRQCSFILYGNKLTLQREYQGSITMAKRAGLLSVVANAIFKGDQFKFEIDHETGLKKIMQHETSFESYGGEVIGAYAIAKLKDGRSLVEVMTMTQIRKAWEQGPMKGNSPAHKNFPDQMAMKTAISRCLKPIINSSDDAALFDSEDDETANGDTPSIADTKLIISENANKGDSIGFDDADGQEHAIGQESAPNEANSTQRANQSDPAETVEAVPVNSEPQEQEKTTVNPQAGNLFDGAREVVKETKKRAF